MPIFQSILFFSPSTESCYYLSPFPPVWNKILLYMSRQYQQKYIYVGDLEIAEGKTILYKRTENRHKHGPETELPSCKEGVILGT